MQDKPKTDAAPEPAPVPAPAAQPPAPAAVKADAPASAPPAPAVNSVRPVSLPLVDQLLHEEAQRGFQRRLQELKEATLNPGFVPAQSEESKKLAAEKQAEEKEYAAKQRAAADAAKPPAPEEPSTATVKP